MLKLSRVEAGHYRSGDGKVEIVKRKSQQTHRADEITWALYMDGKLVGDYETKREAEAIMNKKLTEIKPTAEEEAAHKTILFKLEGEKGSDPIRTVQCAAKIYDNETADVNQRSGEQCSDPMPAQWASSQITKVVTPVSTLGNIIKQATQPQLAAPHLIVQARAGTGKTTTLIGGIKIMMGIDPGITPSPQQQAVWDCMALSKGVKSICFVAFNKSIAEELKRRVPVGCEAMTMHGMGFKAVTRAFPKVRVNEHRVDDIIASLMGRDIRDLRRESPVFVSTTKQLVNLCKMNLVGLGDLPNDPNSRPWCPGASDSLWTEQLNELVDHYDIEFEGTDKAKVFGMVPKVLERCRDVQRDGCIDFSDMIWLPIALNLPVYKYGVLLVDEAQDLNRCQQELAKRAGQRLILCGDPSQAIYGFAGADSESMKRMGKELPGCITLPLTVTRRCGKAIVVEAKKYVSDFEAHESNPAGTIGRGAYDINDPNNYRTKVQDGDMILCRCNAPLVSECFKFIKQGRKAVIQGRDIGQGLISTITKMKATSVENLVQKISDWLHREVSKENAKRNPSEARIQALEDRHDCIIVFTEGAKVIEDVIAKIESIFTDNKDTKGIRLSSVHKAKGLEAHRVFWLRLPKTEFVPENESHWQTEQRYNLMYVAVTRAIDELVVVS